MSQRLTRKEIKQKDQFMTSMESTVSYGRSNMKSILTAVGLVVAAILLTVAVVRFLGHQKQKASLALADAMNAYEAPILEAGSVDNSGDLSFPDEVARRSRAKELFEAVRSKYGSTDAADVAGIFLAKIATEDGDLETARAEWTAYAEDHRDDVLSAQVRLNLLALERKDGNHEKVVEDLRVMLESDQKPLPEDAILHELATTLEDLDRPQEALPYYQRIVDEFPRSPYTPTAQQKASSLAEGNPASAG